MLFARFFVKSGGGDIFPKLNVAAVHMIFY